MKFLEIAELELLSRALDLSTPTLRVSTRIEAYSCKAISRERKLFKALESELIQDISHSTSVSPPEQHPGLLDSAFGPLDKRASRKTLWLLIGLLNVAFPDHDFSKVRPEEFRREEGPRAVLASLSAALDHLRSPPSQRSFSSYPPATSLVPSTSPYSDPLGTTPTQEGDALATHPHLRSVLDPVIDLAECEVFTYTPDMDSDPYAADSDDDSDNEEDDGAYERDDDALGWEMDGVDGSSRSSAGGSSAHFALAGPSWQGGYGTPRKSFSSFVAPDTPTGSIGDPEDWGQQPEKSSTLLYSSHWFLYNRSMKRILFVSTSAHGRNRGGNGYGMTQVGRLKRRASTTSVSSMILNKKKSRA